MEEIEESIFGDYMIRVREMGAEDWPHGYTDIDSYSEFVVKLRNRWCYNAIDWKAIPEYMKQTDLLRH